VTNYIKGIENKENLKELRDEEISIDLEVKRN